MATIGAFAPQKVSCCAQSPTDVCNGAEKVGGITGFEIKKPRNRQKVPFSSHAVFVCRQVLSAPRQERGSPDAS